MTIIFLIGVFCVSNVKKHTLRVAIIDGGVTNFKTHERIIKEGSSESEFHGNSVFNILRRNVDAKKVQYFSYSILDENLSFDEEDLLKALSAAEKDHVDIINLSLSSILKNENVQTKVEQLIRKNIIIVAAGGNGGPGKPNYPARLSGVIAVGSKVNSRYSDFSPDEGLEATADGENESYQGKKLKGTSFSTPKITNMIIKRIIDMKESKRSVKKEYLVE